MVRELTITRGHPGSPLHSPSAAHPIVMAVLVVGPALGLGEITMSGPLGLVSLVDPVVTELPTSSNRSRMHLRP